MAEKRNFMVQDVVITNPDGMLLARTDSLLSYVDKRREYVASIVSTCLRDEKEHAVEIYYALKGTEIGFDFLMYAEEMLYNEVVFTGQDGIRQLMNIFTRLEYPLDEELPAKLYLNPHLAAVPGGEIVEAVLGMMEQIDRACELGGE